MPPSDLSPAAIQAALAAQRGAPSAIGAPTQGAPVMQGAPTAPASAAITPGSVIAPAGSTPARPMPNAPLAQLGAGVTRAGQGLANAPPAQLSPLPPKPPPPPQQAFQEGYKSTMGQSPLYQQLMAAGKVTQ